MTKATICKIGIFGGIVLFMSLMFAFIINACTWMNVTLAWWLFGGMFLAFIIFLMASIFYIKLNYEKIKAYIKKIIN